MSAKKRFNNRAFISLTTLLVFIVMSISGIILYVCPATISGEPLRPMGLKYGHWVDIHVIFSFTFILFGIVHILLNLKPIMAYLKGKISITGKYRLEALVALTLAIILFTGTVCNAFPFGSFLDLGSNIKVYMSHKAQSECPATEKSPSIRLFLTPQTPPPEISQSPSTAPISTDKQENPLEKEVDCQGSEGCGRGRGTGYYSLEELCEIYNIDLSKALKKLQSKGIEATPNSKIRHIADKLGLLPDTILRILLKM